MCSESAAVTFLDRSTASGLVTGDAVPTMVVTVVTGVAVVTLVVSVPPEAVKARPRSALRAAPPGPKNGRVSASARAAMPLSNAVRFTVDPSRTQATLGRHLSEATSLSGASSMLSGYKPPALGARNAPL
jgi:hypothetical protein